MKLVSVMKPYKWYVETELNNVTDTETINESTSIPDIQKDSKKVQFDMSTVQI